MMRININGVDVDPAEFFTQQQEEIRRQEEEEKRIKERLLEVEKQYKEAYKCNNALIGNLTTSGASVYCSIDRLRLPNLSICKECKAYNDTVYE